MTLSVSAGFKNSMPPMLLIAVLWPSNLLAEPPLVTEEDVRQAQQLFGEGPTEADFFQTDELLISATGSLKPVFQAPSVATVITKEEIEAMGATTLDEVLETVTGLHVSESITSTFSSTWSIRGILTDLNPHVLFLVNGIPVVEPFKGTRPEKFRFPLSMVSRIEVVRGPGSAIHGADAFSGSVNIITKDYAEIDGTNAGIRYGSFKRKDAWIQRGHQWHGWDLSIGIEFQKSDGDTDRIVEQDLQSSLDSVFDTNASLAPGSINTRFEVLNGQVRLAKENWEVNFWGWTQEDAGAGPGLAGALNSIDSISTDAYLFDLGYRNSTAIENWDVQAKYSYLYQTNDPTVGIFPAGAVIPIGTDGNIDFVNPAGVTLFTDGVIGNPKKTEQEQRFEWVGIYSGLNQHALRLALGLAEISGEYQEYKNFGPGILDGTQTEVGGDLTDVTGTPFIYAPDVTRRLKYFSVQDEWAFAKHWELTAGMRYDDYSDFGGSINPRLALVWQARFDLVTKFLYGRAFRAPSFADLYARNNPIALGNPNLDPETLDMLEGAVEWRPSADLRIGTNIFKYQIKDLIEFVPDPDGDTSSAQNVRDQQGHGLEWEMDWEANKRLRIQTNLAWQDSEDKNTGKPVPNTPELQAYANLHWEFKPDWSLDTQWFWIGDRKRAKQDVRPKVDDYHWLNLTLRRKNIFPKADIAIAMRNVLDEEAREPTDASVPNDNLLASRAVWVELRTQF